MGEQQCIPVGVAALVGGGLAAAGSFLPWVATSGAISRSEAGITGDGRITLWLAIGALPLAVAMCSRPVGRVVSWVVTMLGLLIAGVAAYDLQGGVGEVTFRDLDAAPVHATWGDGIYAVLIGGVVMLFAGYFSLRAIARLDEQSSPLVKAGRRHG